jgi:DNA-binding Lrp family transcriptional regulator
MLENDIKLDVKDIKLLYYLSIDARISDTQLAKKITLSKNAVKYRVERLKKLGIIKQFSATINLGTLDLDTFTLLLKFNEDIYKNQKIINFFKNHEFADWVAILSGDWDIFAEFVCKDLSHLFNIIDSIIKEFGSILNTYQLLFSRDTLRVEHLISEFYKKINLPSIPVKPRRIEITKIDKTDKKILNLLAQNSSLSFHEIAYKLNLTLDIVRYRIKNLIKQQIIVKFFPEISLPKLGYTEYLYILKLKNIPFETMVKLKQEITLNNNIEYAFFDKSSSCLAFVCAFKFPEQIDSLSRGLRAQFSSIIESQTYLIIKEQVLFNLFPKGLID